MSSFNYFSPSSRNSNRNLFGPSSSPSPSPSISSPIISSITSSLNPTASSYIPLNAAAAPYIPLSPQITKNVSKPIVPPKKTPYPSFAYYTKMNSATIYNATSHCRQRSEYPSSSCSDISSIPSSSSSIMDTPSPASVTSSVYSECNSIDLDNIEPYIPNNRLDIDLVYTQNTRKPIIRTGHNKLCRSTDVISEEVECDTYSDRNSLSSSDESIHPVIAALTAEESAKLLNAPIWSPQNDINNDEDEEEEEEEKEECIHFSKIAMDEEDYQYIMHPNKKPVKYSYIDANRACNSKIAMDDNNNNNNNNIYPPHIQYMQQYQFGGSYTIQQEIGETYDEYTQQLVVASNITLNDGYTETNTMTVQSTITKTATLQQQTVKTTSDGNDTQNISPSDRSSSTTVSPITDTSTHCTSTSQSNIAPPDPATVSIASDTSNTSILTKDNYYTKRCNKHLYKTRASRVAMEGYDDNNNNNKSNIDITNSSKVAMDFMAYNYHETNYYNSLYSESRVASPNIQQISYIYCRS